MLPVVLPGRAGRRPVLSRLRSFARVSVLVPSSELARSAWAKEVVDSGDWIEWAGTLGDIEKAEAAVQAWRCKNPSRSIAGIMSYDEFGVELCAHIGERLGVTCTPAEQIRAFRDKRLFRERCRAAGLPAVRFAQFATQEELERVLTGDAWRFPCVLKPAKGAGSWHVTKVDDAEDLRRAFAAMGPAMREGGFPQEVKDAGFLLEEYFAGHEVDVDGFARKGRGVEFKLVSDNRPAVEPLFLELGGTYPSQLPEPAVRALEELTDKVVEAFPGVHGCFHFEAKIDPKTLEVMPIEFNARCGGAECPASVHAVSGYYLPEVAARLALDLPVEPADPSHAVVASTNVHIFKDGCLTECSDQGIDAKSCNLVTSVLFGEVGQSLLPSNGSASCLGFIAAGGQTAEEAEQNLERAIGQTRISVEQTGST
uniref:ATP-grasp domain-containing protein n=1 Tax=Zooxanthella nutricula TaxID=1333877 RepID=A0A7S2PXE9_9DINO|mmetsp:Transcript_72030/g.220472  ORF Transcript_72030/g.220472 Transcript_72030/m.220472 type:complete len:425 (+) Transcript_72030:1-1275(+)